MNSVRFKTILKALVLSVAIGIAGMQAETVAAFPAEQAVRQTGQFDLEYSLGQPVASGHELARVPEAANTCPASQGFWKDHPARWPIPLTLGSEVYTQPESLSLLQAPPEGDASIVLAKQLIAASLNVKNGADPEPIGRTMLLAQNILSEFERKLPYLVEPSSPRGQEMIAASELLDSYNQDALTPGCRPMSGEPVGSVSGSVTEGSLERPIEGAVVVATLDGLAQRQTTTDVNGLYAMLGMPPGSYVFEAFHPEFMPARPRDIELFANQITRANFQLQPRGFHPTAVACWVDLVGSLICNDPNNASVPPLTTVQLDGLLSFDPDGDRLSYAWRVAAAPAGSAAQIQDRSNSAPTLFLDLAGEYIVCLTVTDATGLASPESCVTIHASPTGGLLLQVTWDTARTDLDLHFLHPNGYWGDLTWDCHWQNPSPNWGDPSSQADDPSLDLDDVDGFGPENLSLTQPEEGVAYRLGVHYFADHGGGPTVPTIRIFVDGSLVYEKVGSPLQGAGYFWEVAEITWSGGTAVVTEMDQITPTIP